MTLKLRRKLLALIVAGFCLAVPWFAPALAIDDSAAGRVHLAASEPEPDAKEKKPETPEQKMAARFPQPVKIGDLIGLAVLDGQDRTLGYVEKVVRRPTGKIQLIVPYAPWFGWVKSAGPFSGWRRPVAVPIEVVAILGRHINAVDMDRPEFDKAARWVNDDSATIGADEVIRIALGKC